MQRLVVIADDFGASPAVNAAVVQAHRSGILTAASLMVNEAAFDEAVRFALATSTLAVGLHLALSLSRATLPASRIPALVNAEGRFPASSRPAGLRYQFSRRARVELEGEIRAQLDRFRATGRSNRTLPAPLETASRRRSSEKGADVVLYLVRLR
jgi:chitin disaccharide deacetylase